MRKDERMEFHREIEDVHFKEARIEIVMVMNLLFKFFERSDSRKCMSIF